MRFKEYVQDKLANRSVKLPLRKIAADTGLPIGWVHNLAHNRLMTVDADKLQTLFEYLTGDKARLNF